MTRRNPLLLFCICTFVFGCGGETAPVGPNGLTFLIAYEAQGDIYLVNSQGADIQRLTFDGQSGHPRWSPDGEWVAYNSFTPDKELGIFRMRPDGTTKELITTTGAPTQIAPLMFEWSPNGAYIAFISADYELVVFDMETRQKRTLTQAQAALPLWSPNSARILFSFVHATPPRAHVISIDGSGLRSLTSEFHHSFASDWSKDGSEILVGCSRDSTIPSPINLFACSPEGIMLRQLTFDGKTSSGAYSPDGFSIFFVDSSRNLCSMNIDGSSKKTLLDLGRFSYIKLEHAPNGNDLLFLRLVQTGPILCTLVKTDLRTGQSFVLEDSAGTDFDIRPK